MDKQTTTAGESRRRSFGFSVVAVLAAALLLPACAPASPNVPDQATDSQPAATAAITAPARSAPTVPTQPVIPIQPATLPAAAAADPAPTSLTVEGTLIDFPVVPGGVSPEGAMEIPDVFDEAAWYRYGPAPGAAEGAAVIAGHIDTTSDRAPFSALKNLSAGTAIRVGRDGAPALTYRVIGVELMAKDKFDGDSLFRRTGPHELKVVTCGGRWLDERMDYSDNVIVTAVLE
jgi:hypothetical protein